MFIYQSQGDNQPDPIPTLINITVPGNIGFPNSHRFFQSAAPFSESDIAADTLSAKDVESALFPNVSRVDEVGPPDTTAGFMEETLHTRCVSGKHALARALPCPFLFQTFARSYTVCASSICVLCVSCVYQSPFIPFLYFSLLMFFENLFSHSAEMQHD